MSTLKGHRDAPADERAIRSLSARSGVALPQVRVLLCQELARLGMGARVGSYLAVLTASNVRAMLQRKARLTHADAPLLGNEHPIEVWEDDGGRLAAGKPPVATPAEAARDTR